MTLAERRLVEVLVDAVGKGASQSGTPVPILNVGAGTSTVIENELLAHGVNGFVADRVDVSNCAVEHPKAGKAYRCSIEKMPDVPSAAYRIAFSVYVLEHVPDLRKASRELFRVLAPSGLLVATVPNPRAFEFVISKHTSTAFHRRAKSLLAGAKHVWETHYDFKSVRDLSALLVQGGFVPVETAYSSCLEMYLRRFRALRLLARCYDAVVNALGLRLLQGNACLILRKPPY